MRKLMPIPAERPGARQGPERVQPTGLTAGAPLSVIDGPAAAFALVADELVQAEQELFELVHSDVREVPEIARYLLDAGGKRLRPALTALAARAVGHPGPIARLMCVGELIHLGSLLHDDVVDDGQTRRGRTTAHRVYGSPTVVLTGDFCLARAVLLASEEGGHAAVHALARAVTEMAEGEVLQLKRAGDLDSTREAYLQVIDRKSAALIAWCASAPAHAIGDARAAEALASYGRAVGRAFQVTDDVLDYAATTGKTRGADLLERKVTLPLLYAMQADPGIRHALDGAAPSEASVESLIARIEATGAVERALGDARAWVERGQAALETLPESRAREALSVLGSYLVERTG